MKTKNKYLCGALAVGVTGCLYLSQCSEFRHKETNKKQPETEMISKQDSTSVDSTKIKEEQKLIGYSMIDAFRHGVTKSVTEYVKKVPYDVDTVDYAGQADECIQFGYYDDDKGRIVICYIRPDTISITGLSVEDKQRIVSFANYSNSLLEKYKAHESGHQSSNPNKEIGKDIDISDKTERSIFEYNTTAEETALLCYHDELRGRFFEFLYIREQFKENDDSITMEIEYPWYKDAFDRGYINPYSSDPKDQRKEQIFCMKNVKQDFEQEDIEAYTDYVITRTSEHAAFDEEKGSEYAAALDFDHTYIWDGQLASLNFFTDGTISDFKLSPEVKLAAKEKEELDAYHKYEEQEKLRRKAEAENNSTTQSDTAKTATTVTSIPVSYYKSYSR